MPGQNFICSLRRASWKWVTIRNYPTKNSKSSSVTYRFRGRIQHTVTEELLPNDKSSRWGICCVTNTNTLKPAPGNHTEYCEQSLYPHFIIRDNIYWLTFNITNDAFAPLLSLKSCTQHGIMKINESECCQLSEEFISCEITCCAAHIIEHSYT